MVNIYILVGGADFFLKDMCRGTGSRKKPVEAAKCVARGRGAVMCRRHGTILCQQASREEGDFFAQSL